MEDPIRAFEQLLLTDESAEKWMTMNNFISKILNRYRKTTDKEVKRSNVRKFCDSVKNGCKSSYTDQDGKEVQQEVISLFSVVRFIMYHSQHYSVCDILAKYIIQKVFQAEQSDSSSEQSEPSPEQSEPYPTTPTVLELYRCIAKEGFGKNYLRDIWLADFDVSPIENIPYGCHRNEFNDHEWKRISLFEHHFIMHIEANGKKAEDLYTLPATYYLF